MIDTINQILVVEALLLGLFGFILIVVGVIKVLKEPKLNKSSASMLAGGLAFFVLMCISCMLFAVVPDTDERGTVIVCEKCDSEVSSTVETINVSKFSDATYEVTEESGLCDECSKSLRDSAIYEFENENWKRVKAYLQLVGEYGELTDEEEALLSESTLRLKCEEALEYLESGKEELDKKNYSKAAVDFTSAKNGFTDIQKKDPELAKELNTEKRKKEAQDLYFKTKVLKSKEERLIEMENMQRYERDTGVIGIAVTTVKFKKSVGYRYSRGDSRFILVYVSAENSGSSTEHVNPNDFTLSTPDGYTDNHDTSTYSLSNYFDSINLPSGGNTGGWLVFYMSEHDYYYLNYESRGNSARKKIYVTE